MGNIDCTSACSIPNGAQILATYIANTAPIGDVILVGFSMGGLIARDLILSNYIGALTGRKVTLITLGTPSLGYPYTAADTGVFCPYLVQSMAGNWRALQPSNNWPALSSYLYPTTNTWQSGSFPGASGYWLAAYGQSCSVAQRNGDASTGCQDNSPTSDGVVCADSASYNISTPTGIGPSFTWSGPDRQYVHSNAGWGKAASFVLCGNSGSAPVLSAPLPNDPLFQTIVAVINGR